MRLEPGTPGRERGQNCQRPESGNPVVRAVAEGGPEMLAAEAGSDPRWPMQEEDEEKAQVKRRPFARG